MVRLEIGPDRVVTITVNDDASLHAEVTDGRHPEAEQTVLTCQARNPHTLATTLREYGVELAEWDLEALWDEQRNARFRRLASLPEDHPERVQAQKVLERTAGHLKLLSDALTPSEPVVTDPFNPGERAA